MLVCPPSIFYSEAKDLPLSELQPLRDARSAGEMVSSEGAGPASLVT